MSDLGRQFIAAETLFGGDSGRATNLVILDACRDNPFSPTSGARSSPIPGLRGTSAGLSRVQAPSDTLVAFATSPGAVALDGAGANSPYAAALARVMQEPGARAEDIFIRVRNIVSKTTGGRQTPWETSSLTQRVILRPAGGKQILTTTEFDGFYSGALTCERAGNAPLAGFAKPGGRPMSFRVRDGRASAVEGRSEAIRIYQGGNPHHERMDLTISENGAVRILGGYQWTDTRIIGEPLLLKPIALRGKIENGQMVLRGSRGPRRCMLKLSQF